MSKKKTEKVEKGLKSDFYSLTNIRKFGASYNMIIGERSNGKTYAALMRGLERYFQEGKQIAYIRRWNTDIQGGNGKEIFGGIVRNGEIERLSSGKWNSIYSYSGKFYLAKIKEGKDGNETRITAFEPFCYSFALNSMEHYKSNNYQGVGTIIFDEFISSNGVGLGDQEFMLFMNMLSTIIRDPSRKDIELYMLANTVNWDSPYFREFGLGNVRKQEQGTIEFYEYGNSNCNLALEYCESRETEESKEGDRFFAFDNPHLQMITNGSWEMEIYPHCPAKYKPKEVKFRYFLQYNDDLLQADVIKQGRDYYTYWHVKTGEVKDLDKDLLFTNLHQSPKFNVRINLFKPQDRLGQRLVKFYKDNKVFYQDNVVGTIINNYRSWCSTI